MKDQMPRRKLAHIWPVVLHGVSHAHWSSVQPSAELPEHYQHLPTMTMRPTQTSYVGLGHELSMLQHCLEWPMRVTIALSGH